MILLKANILVEVRTLNEPFYNYNWTDVELPIHINIGSRAAITFPGHTFSIDIPSNIDNDLLNYICIKSITNRLYDEKVIYTDWFTENDNIIGFDKVLRG